MKFKPLIGIGLMTISFYACQTDGNKLASVTVAPVTSQKKAIADSSKSNVLDSFKRSKNETALLGSLYKKIGQQSKTDSEKAYRLLKLEEIKLYGSNEPYTLIYVDIIDGPMSCWPYKQLFILNAQGKIKANFLTEKYEPFVVFKDQSPLLMVTEETAKANGIHHFIGIERENIKEYLNTNEWKILTINGKVYKPKILPFHFDDVNHDGQIDIIFSGKKGNSAFLLPFIWDSQKGDFEYSETKKDKNS